MTDFSSPTLLQIYELELALGNVVIRSGESGLERELAFTVVFGHSLHRTEIHQRMELASAVRWQPVDGLGGYVDEETGETVLGPMPSMGEVVRDIRHRLSRDLIGVLEFECARGNVIRRIDEPDGTLYLVAVVFERPLRRSEIEAAVREAAKLKWWENPEPLPGEGGFKCGKTGHVVCGPLR